MSYANMLTKIVNDAWQDGILTGLFVVAFLFYKNHIVPEIEKHHKSKHLNAALDATERFAGIIIPEMSKMSSLSNSDRKKEAIKFVSLQLLDHGFHVPYDIVSCTVEKVFQYMKGMGHLDIDKPKKTLDPSQMTPQQLSHLTPPDVNNGGVNNGQNH